MRQQRAAHEQAHLRIGPLAALAAAIGPIGRAIVDVRRRIRIVGFGPPAIRRRGRGHDDVCGRACEDRAVGVSWMKKRCAVFFLRICGTDTNWSEEGGGS